MDLYKIATSGGFRFLSAEALPSVSSVIAAFENAPDKAALIQLSIYTGTIYLTWDGATNPVVGSVGNSLGPGTYFLVGEPGLFRRALAIGAGVTGYVSYWGTNG